MFTPTLIGLIFLKTKRKSVQETNKNKTER